ncbi:MAG: cytochrome c biogenesis CcdA family protein [Candidatus Hodarchaeales archaeon]|jgi:cytochrome c-type biogenesis protein
MADIISIFLLSFSVGLITSFQPCLFPILPSYFSYITQSEKDKLKGLFSSLALTLGIMTIFLFIALLVKAGMFGIKYLIDQYSVEFNMLMAIFLFILGLFLILGFSLPFSERAPSFAQKILQKSDEDRFLTPFLMGLLYTLIAAPCGAPIFLALLPIINSLDAISAIFFVLIYSLGAGMPFIILGGIMPEIKSSLISNYQIIGEYVNIISGVLLFLMSFFLINAYVIPYNPITIGPWHFNGFEENLLAMIYLIGLGVPLLILSGFVIILYLKNQKKPTANP